MLPTVCGSVKKSTECQINIECKAVSIDGHQAHSVLGVSHAIYCIGGPAQVQFFSAVTATLLPLYPKGVEAPGDYTRLALSTAKFATWLGPKSPQGSPRSPFCASGPIWSCVAKMTEEHMEEESLQVLPIDDELCQATDASIHQAVAAAMEPFERRLLELACACPVPIGGTLVNLPLGVSLLERPPQKRKAEKPEDLGIFESLRKTFTRSEPSVEVSPQGPLELPLLSDDGDSPAEAEPSHP
ncbi:hypothetical protein NDU88_008478 [Pleurodeles waltl]|uniref:Uncharacterized protein n=1 Tax=Pleurodeles waltl TaxID=8319 RepID=A0AAV7RWZ5_PLEWA|nr:hypothetical protein NDU88_008478 [Pleurodeles waltl]